MQEIFNRYINYLEAERGVSPYTVRNYTNDLLGNYARGAERGFFQFLRLKKIGSLGEVDKHVLRDYITWLMEQGVVKASIAQAVCHPLVLPLPSTGGNNYVKSFREGFLTQAGQAPALLSHHRRNDTATGSTQSGNAARTA